MFVWFMELVVLGRGSSVSNSFLEGRVLEQVLAYIDKKTYFYCQIDGNYESDLHLATGGLASF